jgi:hypothetical protein
VTIGTTAHPSARRILLQLALLFYGRLSVDHRPHDKCGTNVQRSILCFSAKPYDRAFTLNQVRHLRAHAYLEGGILASHFHEKVEKVSLRHEGDVAALGRQVREIHYREL